jgi:hypothetical protein
MTCHGLQPGDRKKVAITSCSIAANVCSKKYNVTVALKMIYCIFRSDEMESNAAFLNKI